MLNELEKCGSSLQRQTGKAPVAGTSTQNTQILKKKHFTTIAAFYANESVKQKFSFKNVNVGMASVDLETNMKKTVNRDTPSNPKKVAQIFSPEITDQTRSHQKVVFEETKVYGQNRYVSAYAKSEESKVTIKGENSLDSAKKFDEEDDTFKIRTKIFTKDELKELYSHAKDLLISKIADYKFDSKQIQISEKLAIQTISY